MKLRGLFLEGSRNGKVGQVVLADASERMKTLGPIGGQVSQGGVMWEGKGSSWGLAHVFWLQQRRRNITFGPGSRRRQIYGAMSVDQFLLPTDQYLRLMTWNSTDAVPFVPSPPQLYAAVGAWQHGIHVDGQTGSSDRWCLKLRTCIPYI